MALRLLGTKLDANRCDEVILELALAPPFCTGGAPPLPMPSFLDATIIASSKSSSITQKGFLSQFEKIDDYGSGLYSRLSCLTEPDQ